jgi:biopolymer transport protein ExbD
MSMNVGPASEDGEEQLNNTINTTPLVDVMLVLLIIFLITIPVVTQSIKLEARRKTAPVNSNKLKQLLGQIKQA